MLVATFFLVAWHRADQKGKRYGVTEKDLAHIMGNTQTRPSASTAIEYEEDKKQSIPRPFSPHLPTDADASPSPL